MRVKKGLFTGIVLFLVLVWILVWPADVLGQAQPPPSTPPSWITKVEGEVTVYREGKWISITPKSTPFPLQPGDWVCQLGTAEILCRTGDPYGESAQLLKCEGPKAICPVWENSTWVVHWDEYGGGTQIGGALISEPGDTWLEILIHMLLHLLLKVDIQPGGLCQCVAIDGGLKVLAFNGTATVTSLNADTNDTIDSETIHGSLRFDEYGAPWSQGQEVTIYKETGTISEPIDNSVDITTMGFTPYGSDYAGIPKVHTLGEIYVSGKGALLRNNTDVSVYVMPFDVLIADYSSSKALVSKIARADNWGNLPPTFLWKPTEPEYVGEYNIWVDRDNSGCCNTGDMVNYLRVEAPAVECFIATTAYGTPMAEEIEILRQFRDEYLLTNPAGKGLVEFYYKVSPPIAEFITEHPSLKPIVRAWLVPVVGMSTIAINTTPTEKAAIIGLVVLVSAALAVWAMRRRGRDPERT